jgi:WD40 repeat protein
MGLPPAFNILLIVSRPIDLKDLPNLADQLAIDDGLRRITKGAPVNIEILRPPTKSALIQELNNGYEVVHFDGHGGFGICCPNCYYLNSEEDNKCSNCESDLEGQKAQGYLAFEKEDGTLYSLSAKELAEIIMHDPESPTKLLFLSACESAKGGGSGLMDTLLRCGIPAVLGMKEAISAKATMALAAPFYASLAAGNKISEALEKALSVLESMDYALNLRDFPFSTKNLSDLREIPVLDGPRREARLLTANVIAKKRIKQKPPDTSYAFKFKGEYIRGNPPRGRKGLLWRTMKALLDNNKIVVLTGIGGIGKTYLAAETARRMAWNYPGGVFWGRANIKPFGLNELLNRFDQPELKEYFKTNFRDLSLDEKQDQILSYLKDPDNRSLLVIDNADEIDDKKLWMFLEGLPESSAALVTTREDMLCGGYEIHVDKMTEYESLRIFKLEASNKSPRWKSILGGTENPSPEELKDLNAIMVLLNGHPYGLMIAAGMLAEVSISVIRNSLEKYPPKGISDKFDFSYNLLSKEEKILLQIMSVFEEPIAYNIIQTLCNNQELGMIDCSNCLPSLVRKSMIEKNDDIDPKYELHPLMRQYAASKVGDNRNLHRYLIESYKIICNGDWPSIKNDGYFFQHLAFHLVHGDADNIQELRNLLFNLHWIESRLKYTDITALISDYSYINNDKEINRCRDALRLSAYVLSRDIRQLPGQILGRLLGSEPEFPGISSLIRQAKNWKDPWLRPLKPTLVSPGGPLIMTLKSLKRSIRALAVANDEGINIAISGSSDGFLEFWDLENGKDLRPPLKGHKDPIHAVAISRDGKVAVSGSDDKTIKIWNVKTGHEIGLPLKGHEGPIRALAITDDGKKAISGSIDGTLRVWDLDKCEELTSMRKEQKEHPIRAMAITPGGEIAVSGSVDGIIKIWNFRDPEKGPITVQAHTDMINTVAINSSGNRVVSGSVDGTIGIWNPMKSEAKPIILKCHVDMVNAVAIALDGQIAVSGSYDNTIRVWDLNNLDSKKPIGMLLGHSGSIRAIAMTPNSWIVSTSEDNTLKIWDLRKISENRELIGHSGWVNKVAIAENGKIAISVSDDTTLKIWNAETGEELGPPKDHHDLAIRSLSITPDSTMAVSGSYDTTLKVWNLKEFNVFKTLIGHSGPIRTVAITVDGKKAISGSVDWSLMVWDLVDRDKVGPIKILKGHNGPVRTVAITSDGKKAISGSYDNTLKIWDLYDSEEIEAIKTFEGHSGWVNEIAILNGNIFSASEDGTIKVWDLYDLKKEDPIRTLRGHKGPVRSIAIAQDANTIISGSDDGTLNVWFLSKRDDPIKRLRVEEQVGPITALAITPDGTKAAIGYEDNSIRLWDIDKETSVQFIGNGRINAIAIDPLADVIVAGETSGHLHFLIPIEFSKLSPQEKDLSDVVSKTETSPVQYEARSMQADLDVKSIQKALDDSVLSTKSELGYLALVAWNITDNHNDATVQMKFWSRRALAECKVPHRPTIYRKENMGLWGESLRKTKVVITNDYPRERLRDGYPIGHFELHCYMSIPIFGENDKIIALVGIANKREENGDFGEYNKEDEDVVKEKMNSAFKKSKNNGKD